jgi:Na+-transporting methylmalonyl-CoA/oxaloacetate decarboxylase gamma subunit
MDKWEFGVTMMVVGIAGTFLTLWILGLVMNLLKKAFPLSEEESKTK